MRTHEERLGISQEILEGLSVGDALEWFPGSDRNQVNAVLSFIAGQESQQTA